MCLIVADIRFCYRRVKVGAPAVTSYPSHGFDVRFLNNCLMSEDVRRTMSGVRDLVNRPHHYYTLSIQYCTSAATNAQVLSKSIYTSTLLPTTLYFYSLIHRVDGLLSNCLYSISFGRIGRNLWIFKIINRYHQREKTYNRVTITDVSFVHYHILYDIILYISYLLIKYGGRYHT